MHAREHARIEISKMTITNPRNEPSMTCWVSGRAPRGRETENVAWLIIIILAEVNMHGYLCEGRVCTHVSTRESKSVK